MHYTKKEYEDFSDYKKTKSSEDFPPSADDPGKSTLPDPVEEGPS